MLRNGIEYFNKGSYNIDMIDILHLVVYSFLIEVKIITRILCVCFIYYQGRLVESLLLEN